MASSNVELARRGYEAAARGDLEALEELLAPDVKWHAGDPSAAEACRSRDQALQFMRTARRRRPIGELVEVVGAGDKVVAIMRPISEEGERGQLSANLSTFCDGKVVEMVHYPRAADALAAAGIAKEEHP